jgi:predicted cation transporter
VTVAQNNGSRAQLPFAVVMLVVVIGLVRIVMYHWREGTTEIGLALLLAAFLRAVLPDAKAGLLAVRRKRKMDVLLYGAFGVLMIFISLTIIGGPFSSTG